MTPMRPLILIAWLGCAPMMSSCAGLPRSQDVPPPKLTMPASATEACGLYRLPDGATLADLEVGYATRGAQLVDCDARRRQAVETANAEHALQDQWRGALAQPRPWWRLWR